MDPLFPIGSVCRLFGITPDTLRHYEKKGLLTPVTDPHSRYRYYTPDHLDRIEGILHARAMGIPLAQLGQTMDQESPAAYEALLAAQRQTLQERILALEEVLRQTDRRLATLRELQALPESPVPAPWTGPAFHLYQVEVDLLFRLPADPPQTPGMDRVETWRRFLPGPAGAVREDETVTAFSFPPAPQPTVLEAEFQQLVDLGLARPVTLAPPMDCLPFWGTQQDLLACLGRLPLPGPSGGGTGGPWPGKPGKISASWTSIFPATNKSPSFSTNPPSVAPWFFKEFLRFQKNLSPCLTGLSWADIIKMQKFTVLQTVMFPCGTEERSIFYGKRSRV